MWISQLTRVQPCCNAVPLGVAPRSRAQDVLVARVTPDNTAGAGDSCIAGVTPARAAKFYARRPKQTFDWPRPATAAGAMIGSIIASETFGSSGAGCVPVTLTAVAGALIGCAVDLGVYPLRALTAYHTAHKQRKVEFAKWKAKEAAFIRQYPDGIIASEKESHDYYRAKDPGWRATTEHPASSAAPK